MSDDARLDAMKAEQRDLIKRMAGALIHDDTDTRHPVVKAREQERAALDALLAAAADYEDGKPKLPLKRAAATWAAADGILIGTRIGGPFVDVDGLTGESLTED